MTSAASEVDFWIETLPVVPSSASSFPSSDGVLTTLGGWAFRPSSPCEAASQGNTKARQRLFQKTAQTKVLKSGQEKLIISHTHISIPPSPLLHGTPNPQSRRLKDNAGSKDLPWPDLWELPNPAHNWGDLKDGKMFSFSLWESLRDSIIQKNMFLLP